MKPYNTLKEVVPKVRAVREGGICSDLEILRRWPSDPHSPDFKTRVALGAVRVDGSIAELANC